MKANAPFHLLRQIIVVASVIAVIVVNFLANALPLNGVTTGEVAARFDVLFQPAPYAFSIWWLIYLGLLGYAIYQVQPKWRDDKRLRSLDLPVVISAAANIGWLLLWHHEQIVASLLAMFVLLGALVVIVQRLAPERSFVTARRRWVVHHPFSVYLGWITIAAVANIAITLDFLGCTAVGQPIWFTVAVLAVLAVASVVASRRADVAYLLTLTWGFIGLGIEHQREPVIAGVAWLGTAVLAVLAGISVVRTDKR